MGKQHARAGRVAGIGVVLLAAAPVAADLEIRGVGSSMAEVLEAFVTVDDLPCDAPRWWVERRHREAPADIRRGMEVLGHYRAEISGRLEWSDDCWEAVYDVTPGEQVRIQRVDLDIEGTLASEPRMQDTMADLDIGPEETFSHRSYENAKSDLVETARSLGYFDAAFSRHRATVNPETNLAEIELTLVGGSRYRIGEVHIEQTALDDELFRRFLRFGTGDAYDDQVMNQTYRDLIDSDFFDRVLVSPRIDARDDGVVPIDVDAAATTRRRALVGAGYATDTGPRLRADMRWRRVNDRGHRANLRTLVSEVQGAAVAEYRIPYDDPINDWLFVVGDISYENTDTSESVSRGVRVGRTHLRWPRWIETNYVEYRTENFEVGEQDGRSQLLLFGTSWARSTSIEAPRPMRGYSLSVDVRGALRTLMSDSDLLQTIIRGRQIVPLGSGVRVIGRVHGGWTFQNEFEDLPPSIRFFAGGDNSVRGYGYEQLGPSRDGDVIGGKRLLTGSLELDVPVKQNWSVAAFVDSGSAFNSTPSFSTGVGLGVRWYSPLGPLRIDLAHPLDDPGRNVRLHISLGPDL